MILIIHFSTLPKVLLISSWSSQDRSNVTYFICIKKKRKPAKLVLLNITKQQFKDRNCWLLQTEPWWWDEPWWFIRWQSSSCQVTSLFREGYKNMCDKENSSDQPECQGNWLLMSTHQHITSPQCPYGEWTTPTTVLGHIHTQRKECGMISSLVIRSDEVMSIREYTCSQRPGMFMLSNLFTFLSKVKPGTIFIFYFPCSTLLATYLSLVKMAQQWP